MHTHASSRLTITLLATTLAACAGASDTGEVTAFEGARLIVGDGSAPVEDAVFLVEGGRFTAVGSRGEVDVPDGATSVDLAGKTVMPAIVNAHAHLSVDRAERIEQLQHMAYYGVGAAISLGHDSGAVAFEMRDELVPGGARSLTAGRGITRPEPGRNDVPYWISTEEEARSAVQELSEQGVELIKIWVDDRNGQYEKLTPELYGAVIDEAHSHNMRVTAHIFSLDDAKGLLRAGLDAFAHSVRDRDVDDEYVEMMRERPNVVLVPNLPGPGVAEDLSWLSGTVPAERLAEMQAASVNRPNAQAAYGIQARNLARLHEAGVTVAFGTDGSTPWAAHQEMADMVSAGMTPSDVITAATSTSAEYLRLSDVGTIAAGKSADFIVLDANPLEDITNTRLIDEVYLRGARVDREALGRRLRGEGAS